MLAVQDEPLDLSMASSGPSSCSQGTSNQTDNPDMLAQLQLQSAFFEVYSMMLAENLMGLMDPNHVSTIFPDLKCSTVSQEDDETPPSINGEMKEGNVKKNENRKSSSKPSKKYKKSSFPETIIEENEENYQKDLKKKYRFSLNVKRFEANARERNRVQQLSNMFENLRTCLPIQNEIKISKLSTLKVASAYIAFLRSILSDDETQIDDSNENLNFELETAKTLKKL